MTLVLVEGVSDAAALEVVAGRLGVRMPRVLPVGGSKGARRAAEAHPGTRLLGLVDAAERSDMEGLVDELFVCEPDLESELLRALGEDAALAVIAEQGELDSFRILQRQPAQRDRARDRQLVQFLAGRSGNKERYARLFALALPADRIPPPLVALVRAASAESASD
jgi:hypothetical protein